MIYFSIDLETTGLDPINDQILEFGCVMEDTNNIKPLNDLKSFRMFIDNGRITGGAFALQMNHEILRKIATKEKGYNYCSPDELGRKFFDWLKEVYPEGIKDGRYSINVAGKNFGTFDNNFLNNNENFGKYVRIRQRIIDPGILYTKWHEDETLPNLDTCLERCNIDSTVSHNAVEDALDVISVLRPSYA